MRKRDEIYIYLNEFGAGIKHTTMWFIQKMK